MPFHTPAEKAKNKALGNPHVTDKASVLSARMKDLLAPEAPNRVMKAKKSTTDIT